MAPPPAALAHAPHGAHALAVYAESLVAQRRVLVVGDASTRLGDLLVELGARVVHVYDPDGARAQAAQAGSPRGVTVRALPEGDFDVRDGAFDLALVPDLGLATDPAALVLRLRRLLGTQGTAVFGARNGEVASGGGRAFDYYELYDLVSLQFEHTRMIAEVPFAGVALAELGAEDVEVSVDPHLAGEAGPPPAFVVLASQKDVRLSPYAIVQLPVPVSGPASGPVPVAAVSEDRSELERTRLALAEAQVRSELAAAQLEELRVASNRLVSAAIPASRVTELEAAVAEQAARAGDNHVRAERLSHELKKLEDEAQRQRDRAFRLTRELEDEKKARTKAELELGMLRKSPELALARERVAYLEEALRSSEEVALALQARLVEVEAAAAAQSEGVALLAAEVDSLRVVAELGQQAAQQVDELAHRTEAAEVLARRLAAELSRERSHDEGHGAELAKLESTLRDRARAIHALEHELARRERMVQELVGALEDSHPERTARDDHEVQSLAQAQAQAHALAQAQAQAQSQAQALAAAQNEAADLRRKLDALAMEVARRESDVQASSWRVAELEQKLAQASSGSASAAGGPSSELLDQIDILKQALAQEHEARTRLEAGEDLTRAKAELERQAAVIEQLSRELDARDRRELTQPT